ALIAKAGSGPGGAIAATLAYRAEYAQVQGELAELTKESAANNCPPPIPAAVPSVPKPKKGKPARG
ncbi:MAG: twin-arginine translocation pathway signal, partial [Hyphomicrobium sp.]|nr:twin-arginine translocation pathway signal [Hyphomicrobium sp.]